MPRGTAYQQTRVNAGATDLEYANPSVFPSSNRAWGAWFCNASTATTGTASGLLSTNVAAITAPTITNSSTDKKYARYDTTTTISTTAGLRGTAVQGMRAWNVVFRCKFRVTIGTGAPRVWIGLWSDVGGAPTGEDAMNARSAVIFGKRAADTNWQVGRNDSAGVTVYTDFLNGGTGSAIAIDGNWHTVEVLAVDATPKFSVSLDGGAYHDFTTEIPATGTGLNVLGALQNSVAASSTLDLRYVEITYDN
jgi:hypothetical protein